MRSIDTTYSVMLVVSIAPASTYSHIVDVVLDSLPRAQNVQVVAEALPLEPVPLSVSLLSLYVRSTASGTTCTIHGTRFDYVVSTAVPCNQQPFSWVWYRRGVI